MGNVRRSVEPYQVVQRIGKLIVGQKAKGLLQAIYQATLKFPKEELSGLTSHLRVASIAVLAHIAEEQDCQSASEYLHRLSQTQQALGELERQLQFAETRGYLEPQESERLAQRASEIGQLISGLSERLGSIG